MVATLLLAACNEGGVPFPYIPNLPGDYNRASLDLRDTHVAIYTHQVFHDYCEGIVSERVACFDTLGHCVEYFYRDRDICQHRIFRYDSLGRRVEEQAWEDSAGVSYDSLQRYINTTYSYSRGGHRCKATLRASDGGKHTFRLRYNRQGRLSRFIYPDGSRFSYDYDTAGRLVCRTWPDASTERFEYDSSGRLTATVGREGERTWYLSPWAATQFDSLGRVTEEVATAASGGAAPIVATYVYDSHGNWVRRTRASATSPTILEVRTFKYY